ncbi:MAG: class I SAM-dependent methyltransferase [Candidatus Longimicrobiales bacterium M2_2A_002]
MLPGGYPPLEIYEAVPRRPLFREMRAFADRFLASNGPALRDYSAQWSRDPLHRWSRRWEYPFVTERVGAAMADRSSEATRALDAGSGLTFFAHWLTHRNPGLRVECLDRDPAVESAAADLGPPAGDRVSYGTGDLASLPYADATFSMVSCISVLEHTANRDAIIREFARVLEPGGVFVLTFDISVDDRWEIPRAEAAGLLGDLDRHFDAEGEYGRMLEDFDADTTLTTDWVREHDPSLLPWRYPHPSDMVRRFPNVIEMFKPRFKSLTCFCGTWRKPG